MEDRIKKAGEMLNDRSITLAQRFRALFLLKNFACDNSVDIVCKCLTDKQEDSALMKHELAYCLGQMQNPRAIPCLIKVLNDIDQDPMVRHEAAEALGAINKAEYETHNVLSVLEKYTKDPSPEVYQTCQLACRRIIWSSFNNDLSKEKPVEMKKNALDIKNPSHPYTTIDPTPAHESSDVEILQKILLDKNESLWDRYKAMFALRNLQSDEATKALAQGLFSDDSALFRHEVAYVLGQIKSPLVVQELRKCLENLDENCMVRHEAVETLGAIATQECRELLDQFSTDSERVVRESCEVAIDMAKHENSNEFQYALC